MSSLMPFRRRLPVAVATLSLFALPHQARPATHAIDAEQSKLQILVGKGGMFSAFGHDHVIDATHVSGSVQFDPADPAHDTVSFMVTTSSLHVTDPGASQSDREKVQLTMLGPTVLDAAQFPEIAFTSTAVSPAASAKAEWTSLDVAGVLRLHGVERPLHVPVQVRAEGTLLRVRGEATIKQTDFGMTPVTVAGGTVRVKDQVKITFDIVAVPR
jgi:polyisoprenoid-binding protein YceI